MTHHRLWPEGRPGEYRETTSGWRAAAMLAAMQLRMLIRPMHARRIRHSRCEEGMPDPDAVEAALEDAGAIAPPGGWPRPRPAPGDRNGPKGDVLITTHSVI